MGLRDTFNFDSDKYARHLKEYSDRELKKKHHQKCLQIIACNFSVGAGIGAAPFTCGLTLASSAYSFRQVDVLTSQKKLIEEECRTRKISVPQERKRDLAIGFGVGVGSAGLGAAIPVGVEWLSGQAIRGAASITSTAFGSTVHHISAHSAELANAANQGGLGLVHGIKETVTSQTHHLAHHGTVGVNELYAPFQHLHSGDAAASVAGVGAGALGTMKVEDTVGHMAGNYALDTIGRKITTPGY